MASLLRCRGSASEMAKLFGAAPSGNLTWAPTSWTGERVPIVLDADEGRLLTTCRWGLPDEAYARKVAAKRRGALYSRDLAPSGSRLRNPASLQRCLIIIESFAYPDGPAGERTRAWFGLWDSALAAWAGLCTLDGACCAGILVQANERVAPVSKMMPRLLAPADQPRWLDGADLFLLGSPHEAPEFYRENLGERWSTGRLRGDAE